MLCVSAWLMTCLGGAIADVQLAPPARGQRCNVDKNSSSWYIHISGILKHGHKDFPALLQALFVASQRCIICKEWLTDLGRR